MKKTVLGRQKLCYWLFGISLAIAFLATAGVLLFGVKSKIGLAIVSALLALFSFYCSPIYFNSAKKHKMLASVIGAIDNGAKTYAEISETTGLSEDACRMILESARERLAITGYEIVEPKSAESTADGAPAKDVSEPSAPTSEEIQETDKEI